VGTVRNPNRWTFKVCTELSRINTNNTQNWYDIPLLRKTLNLFSEAGIHSIPDILRSYNLLIVKEWNEQRLDYQTRDGEFENTEMQFETMKVLGDIEGYINNTICEVCSNFVSTYLNDIGIYSNWQEKCIGYIKWVLKFHCRAWLNLNNEQFPIE